MVSDFSREDGLFIQRRPERLFSLFLQCMKLFSPKSVRCPNWLTASYFNFFVCGRIFKILFSTESCALGKFGPQKLQALFATNTKTARGRLHSEKVRQLAHDAERIEQRARKTIQPSDQLLIWPFSNRAKKAAAFSHKSNSSATQSRAERSD